MGRDARSPVQVSSACDAGVGDRIACQAGGPCRGRADQTSHRAGVRPGRVGAGFSLTIATRPVVAPVPESEQQVIVSSAIYHSPHCVIVAPMDLNDNHEYSHAHLIWNGEGLPKDALARD